MEYLHRPKYFPKNLYSLQKQISSFTVEKSGRHHLNQVFKVNIMGNCNKIDIVHHLTRRNEKNTASLL